MADEGLAGGNAPAPEANAQEQQQHTQSGAALLNQEAPPQDQQQQAPPSETWYSSVQDESLRGWVEAKNYPDMETALRQAYNLEKMRGVPEDQLLKLPRERTPENMRDVYQKLGAPADPSQYQFPDGTTDEQAAWFRKVAHEQGLTVDQAKATYQGIADTINQATTQAREQFLVQSQADIETLKQDWGPEFNDRINEARKARAKLELSDTENDALERSLGTKRFLNLLASIGAQDREAVFIDSNTGVQEFRAMSPSAAKAKLESLKGDPKWNERRLSFDKAAMNEYANLLRIAQGG